VDLLNRLANWLWLLGLFDEISCDGGYACAGSCQASGELLFEGGSKGQLAYKLGARAQR
jgi:hypothetical protein